MTNAWISKMTRTVLSEALPDMPEEEPKAPESKDDLADAADFKNDEYGGSEGEPLPDAADTAGTDEQEDQTPFVVQLSSAWQSGDRMGVASRLMYTPCSYVDFVKLCFEIGPEDSEALGGLLDQLIDANIEDAANIPQGAGDVPMNTPASRILARIHKKEPKTDTAPKDDTEPVE